MLESSPFINHEQFSQSRLGSRPENLARETGSWQVERVHVRVPRCFFFQCGSCFLSPFNFIFTQAVLFWFFFCLVDLQLNLLGLHLFHGPLD